MVLLLLWRLPVMSGEQNLEKATFAAGCFWGVEAAFRQVEGVTDTRSATRAGRRSNRPMRRSAPVRQAMQRPSRSPLTRPGSVREAPLGFLVHPRPHPGEPPGAGYRDELPVCHLLPYPGPEGRGRGVEGAAEEIREIREQANRDRDRSCLHLLEGGGVPPAVLREAQVPGLPYLTIPRSSTRGNRSPPPIPGPSWVSSPTTG